MKAIKVKKKKFNTTGVCIPEMHYMVDITERVAATKAMVDDGEYFAITRPRQYGKTTMLAALDRVLKDEYVIIDSSFEATGDEMFETEAKFCSDILDHFAASVGYSDKPLAKLLRKHQVGVNSFKSLSIAISNLVEEENRSIVLLIDEVDQSSNSKVFLLFLKLLRNKYLAWKRGKDNTFQSVVLAGLHDVKNLKLAIRSETEAINEKRFNSPWNIAVDYLIDMSFSPADIETMLSDYSREEHNDFDIPAVAKRIHEWTNGYPFLASNICRTIYDRFDKDFSVQGVERAVKQIIKEPSTLFDDVIKNIVHNPELLNTVQGVLFSGHAVAFDYYKYELGFLYGIFKEYKEHLAISNRMFEALLYSYLLSNVKVRDESAPLTNIERSQFTETGRLDMPLVLDKFREHMRKEYRSSDGKFIEKQGRLLFLSFLVPIINGKGFYFVEPETRGNKRMDIVVTFGEEKFMIELKIWYDSKRIEQGKRQLADYLDSQNVDRGYLVTFGLGQMADEDARWETINGKDIFQVVV